MHALAIEAADGTRFKVSLRRFHGDHRYATPEQAGYEFAVLRLLESAGVAAPRPLLLDAEGRFFGTPAIVLSYLPGRAFSQRGTLWPGPPAWRALCNPCTP